MVRSIILVVLLIGGLVISGYLLSNFFKNKTAEHLKPVFSSPSPIVLKQAVPKDAYTIILVGDSMTQALGPNTDKLGKYLKEYYPNKVFGIFNLSQGSTNILSVQKRLDEDILPSREFEVIIIESFGHNPLSQYPLEEGLEKQNQALDRIVSSIRNTKSKAKVNSIIAFLATIAPNQDNYGKGAVELSPEERKKWAEERSAYIKNHIEYAKKNDIPLINVYEKSLNKEGTGNLDYIEGVTFIHPSEKGVDLISKEIAAFLYNQRILPP
jgi:lysophospholipase L1-like esterase